MRLRQVVLASRDLDATSDALTRALGLGAPFHDPGVEVFGLKNAVFPVGDTFLEVVCPIGDDAPAARYLEREGGDGGYMVMVQSDDLAADRARIETLGVRVVWTGELDDIAGLHLHPKDAGGAILSLDEPRPPASWRWAGEGWETRSRTDVSRAIVAAEMASPEPGRLARRWSEILDRPVEDGAIHLDRGLIRFVEGERPRLVGFDVEAADRARAGETLELAGVRVRRV